MGWHILAFWALSVVTGTPSVAQQALVQGRLEAAALHFPRALAEVDLGLASGSAEPSELAALHALRGQVLATTGRHPDAVAAYARALELEPTFSLAPGSSPRLRADVAAAAASLQGKMLGFTVRSRPTGPFTLETTVEVQGDALHLAHHAFLVTENGEARFAATTPWQASFTCRVSPCRYRVRVEDGQGNRVRELGTAAAPLFATLPPVLSPREIPAVRRPLLTRNWPYWALGGVAAGVGTYFAIAFAREQAALARGVANPDTPAAAVNAHDVNRRTDRVGAFVAFGVAGGLGLTGLALSF